MIYVSAWLGKPEELLTSMDKDEADKWISRTFGGMLGGVIGMPQIFLDQDLHVNKLCARWGEPCTDPDEECQWRKGDKCQPPRFKFIADIEIEKIAE